MTGTTRTRPPWPASHRALLVVALACAVASGLLAASWAAREPPRSDVHVSRDLDGNLVEWSAPPDGTGSASLPTTETFSAPAVGLEVALRSAVVTAGRINPPTLTDAYWYHDFGDPARPASGTAVVAMHAVRGGNGPGNAFVDLSAGAGSPEVRIARGDLLRVGAARYRVTRWLVEDKASVAADARVWSAADDGDRLVVITCLSTATDPDAFENLVVLARRVGPGQRSRSS